MAGTERSRCWTCGGSGQVRVQQWPDPDVWDGCPDCADQWCTDARCPVDPITGRSLPHLKHSIRKVA